MNRSHRNLSLPSFADLSGCPSLSSLNLGVLVLADTATVLSAQFPMSTYQHSLVDLTLEAVSGVQDIAAVMNFRNLHFPALKSLVVRGGTYYTSLFSILQLQADALEQVELRSMDVYSPARVPIFAAPAPTLVMNALSSLNNNMTISGMTAAGPLPSPTPGSSIANKNVDRSTSRRTNARSEEYWDAFFSQPTLAKLKSFHMKTMMRNVALARGVDPGEDIPFERLLFNMATELGVVVPDDYDPPDLQTLVNMAAEVGTDNDIFHNAEGDGGNESDDTRTSSSKPGISLDKLNC
jgi:hypothetical protein